IHPEENYLAESAATEMSPADSGAEVNIQGVSSATGLRAGGTEIQDQRGRRREGIGSRSATQLVERLPAVAILSSISRARAGRRRFQAIFPRSSEYLCGGGRVGGSVKLYRRHD